MNIQGAVLQAVAGHFADLFDLARFKPKNPRSLSKLRQLIATKKRTGGRNLIETGTYVGNTAYRASFFFETVYTIELDEDLHRSARCYLAKRRNVVCVLGDAAEQLGRLLDTTDVKDLVVFLDGHFSGPGTSKGIEAEPALCELAILARHKPRIASIVIDDFRTFTGQHGIPSRSSLLRALEELFGDYVLTVHLDQVLVERQVSKATGKQTR